MFHEVWELESFQTAKVTIKVIQGHWCHSIGPPRTRQKTNESSGTLGSEATKRTGSSTNRPFFPPTVGYKELFRTFAFVWSLSESERYRMNSLSERYLNFRRRTPKFFYSENWTSQNYSERAEIIEKRKQKLIDRLLQLDYFTAVLNVYSANVFLWMILSFTFVLLCVLLYCFSLV